jgi:1,4-alpha-glucan branching enzyme
MATKKQTNKTSVAPKETPAVATTTSKKATAKPATTAAVKEPVKADTKAATTPVHTTTAEHKATPAVKAEKKAEPAKAETAKTTKVTFILPKEAVENAETVAVLGDFNQWDIKNGIELKKQKDGSFKTAVELEAGRSYQFRFLIDGQRWENAWNAEAYEPTPFGNYNSVVKA